MPYSAEEWLNNNMHRNFPIVDGVDVVDTTGRHLPSDFLCAVHITMPPTDEMDSDSRVFLQSIEPYMSGVRLVFAYDTGSETFPFMRTLEIPRTAELFSEHNMVAFGEYELPAGRDSFAHCTGNVVVGQMDTIMGLGKMSFTPTTGKISSQCVSLALLVQRVTEPGAPSYITVTDSNGVVHNITGDLDIWPGNGIVIDIETDEDEEGRTVGRMVIHSATNYQDGLSGLAQPITSINGMLPNADGDIKIVGDNCTNISLVPGGLAIENPCATPCCTSADLDDVREGLASMDEAAKRILEYLMSLGGNVDVLQARLNALLGQ